MNEDQTNNYSGFKLPFITIIKLLLVLLFLACLKVLAPLLMTLFLATLLAVSLSPIVHWLEKHGVHKMVAVTFVAVVLAGSFMVVVSLIVPQLFKELTNFIGKLPEFKQQILGQISAENPMRPIFEHNLNQQTMVPKLGDMAPLFNMGGRALSGLTEIFLIFIFSIYLIIDGPGVIAWLSAFFSVEAQAKIQQTQKEVSPIIFAYVAGQLITSLLSFLYVFIALTALKVPNALLLATLAGIFDVLPVLGFFLAVVPAMLFALSVSGSTALIVFLLYVIYHGLENYFIIPAVYGKRLRVSSFVVLVTLIAAGLLAGVEGAVAILPLVASYPIVERIWLKRLVGKATVIEHQNAAT